METLKQMVSGLQTATKKLERISKEDPMSYLGKEPKEFFSNCCSAKVYAPIDDWAICMDCKEHCEVVC